MHAAHPQTLRPRGTHTPHMQPWLGLRVDPRVVAGAPGLEHALEGAAAACAQPRMDWDTFCRLMHHWSSKGETTPPSSSQAQGGGDGALFTRRLWHLRVRWINNIATGLKVDTQKLKIASSYRYQHATEWSAEERADAKSKGWGDARATGTDPNDAATTNEILNAIVS